MPILWHQVMTAILKNQMLLIEYKILEALQIRTKHIVVDIDDKDSQHFSVCQLICNLGTFGMSAYLRIWNLSNESSRLSSANTLSPLLRNLYLQQNHAERVSYPLAQPDKNIQTKLMQTKELLRHRVESFLVSS